MEKHLIIIGFDEIVFNKYIPLIFAAIKEDSLDSYSIVDLEQEREFVETQILNLEIKPKITTYLNTPRDYSSFEYSKEFESFIQKLQEKNFLLKVYIATEVRSHEYYLKYCIDNNIDCLVEKPTFCSLENGKFAPDMITPTMESMLNKASLNSSAHSVMTLSRYHEIYNTEYLQKLKEKVISWGTPVTSFHLRASGGVWNRHEEYDLREDHPYKYGYGMIMHGAYHYVDLAAQAMLLNRLIYPNANLQISLSSYAAFPHDQSLRIRGPLNDKIDSDSSYFFRKNKHKTFYGETDITSTFSIQCIDTNQVLMIGTLAFEQTTISIRNWIGFPEGIYNKNGRTSFVELETQLSTFHTSHVQCYDLPLGKNPDKIDAFSRILNRTNASLIENEDYIQTKEFSGLFHSNSNKELMRQWLRNEENKSLLHSHEFTMILISLLSKSALAPGTQQRAFLPK